MTNALSHAFGKIVGFSGIPENEEIQSEQRVVGKIIKIHPSGWGFISSKEIKFTRIFFHWTSLRQDTLNFTFLSVGMMVEFTPKVVEGKGTRAIKVRVIPPEELTTEQQEHQADQEDIDPQF